MLFFHIATALSPSPYWLDDFCANISKPKKVISEQLEIKYQSHYSAHLASVKIPHTILQFICIQILWEFIFQLEICIILNSYKIGILCSKIICFKYWLSFHLDNKSISLRTSAADNKLCWYWYIQLFLTWESKLNPVLWQTKDIRLIVVTTWARSQLA